MQVSAQNRHQAIGGRPRAQPSDPVKTIAEAVELSSGRDGGQPGGYMREGRETASDPPPVKSADKTVFVARALSSTLNQLQIASFAGEPPPVVAKPEAAPARPAGSLDDLISNLLSAA